MTEETAVSNKPRKKPTGPRNYVVKIGDLELLVKLDDVRVASSSDMNKALDGNLPRGRVVEHKD